MTPFFILAHPRCGTKWFSRFFTHGDIFCYHEALGKQCYPNIGRHLHALYNYIPPNTTDVLRAQQHRLATLYPQLDAVMQIEGKAGVGDSDCALPPVALALAEKYPSAAFAFVARSGVDASLSIEAGMTRSPSEEVETMARREIINELGVVPVTLFEVAVGRWCLAVLELKYMYEALPPGRAQWWSFEDIFDANNLSPLRDMWDFLVGGLQEWDPVYAQSMIGQRVNYAGQAKPPGDSPAERWRNLDAARRGAYMRITGALANRLPGGVFNVSQ